MATYNLIRYKQPLSEIKDLPKLLQSRSAHQSNNPQESMLNQGNNQLHHLNRLC